MRSRVLLLTGHSGYHVYLNAFDEKHADLPYFSEVNFGVPGSSPADSPRHQVLFLHYFCPGWLSNWIMNNIPAVIFNGFTPMALSCCLGRGL